MSAGGDLIDVKWTSNDCPRLRPLEAFPIEEKGERSFGLRDPGALSDAVLVLSAAALHVMSLIDGVRSCREICDAFENVVGRALPPDTLHALLDHLENAHFLSGPGFDAFYAQKQNAFRANAVRKSPVPSALDILNGSGELFDELLAGAESPRLSRPVAGLIAPHLDYPRGGPCYANAYATIRDRPTPDRVVILGTNHFGRSTSVVATTVDFETPLGITRTDVDFLRRIESRCGHMRTFELDHEREHSVELQVAWLQEVFGPERFRIVPFLCPNPCGPDGFSPGDGESIDLRDFAATLGELVADDSQDTLIVAGADLSHVGAAFGGDRRLDDEYLEEIRRYDLAALDHLVTGDPDAWVAHVAKDDNPTHFCSAGCIYALAAALPDRQATVFGYHQAVDQPSQTCVTCTAAVYS